MLLAVDRRSSTGTSVLGTRQENMRITGEGEARPAPKLPVMPTTPPVAIGAISRPSSAQRLLLVVLGGDLDHHLAGCPWCARAGRRSPRRR